MFLLLLQEIFTLSIMFEHVQNTIGRNKFIFLESVAKTTSHSKKKKKRIT